jgi:hypothetical protein
MWQILVAKLQQIAAFGFSRFFEKAMVRMLIENDLLTLYPEGLESCDGIFLLLHFLKKGFRRLGRRYGDRGAGG